MKQMKQSIIRELSMNGYGGYNDWLIGLFRLLMTYKKKEREAKHLFSHRVYLEWWEI